MGHLFIVQADLTRLACDAWLLPTSRTLWIEEHWLGPVPDDVKRVARLETLVRQDQPGQRFVCVFDGKIPVPEGWREGATRTFAAPPTWRTSPGDPQPWLTRMARDDQSSPDERARWYAEGARQFVERAASALAGRPPAYGRHKHLLALPVVGTGQGGGWAEAGAVLRQLIEVLTEEASLRDVDIALVTYAGDQLAAAQHARRSRQSTVGQASAWSALPAPLLELGKVLADQSARGELVLFLGAGVSRGAGLPDWKGLLTELATEAGFRDEELKALDSLSVLDRAALIQDRFDARDPSSADADLFRATIAHRLLSDRFSLQHATLANLPVRQAVTTNYDTLFEAASMSSGRKTAVLPYESSLGSDRWLLKLHGCVTHSQDIVLTRQDFIRYADRRAALAGIVQTLLITQHMLFIGYSLEDENFLRIVDDVRKVVRSRSAERSDNEATFATALLLNPSELQVGLWKRDIACIAIDGWREADIGSPASRSLRAAANVQEILLDYVLFESSRNVSHLLDDRYLHLLSDPEKDLRQHLQDMEQKATPAVRDLPAWRLVADMLESLGHGAPGRTKVADSAPPE